MDNGIKTGIRGWVAENRYVVSTACSLLVCIAILIFGCSRTEDPLAKGLSLLAAGNADQAATALQRAIESHPDDPSVHANLGIAYLELGRPEDAVEALKRAAVLAPADPRPLEWLAVVYAQLGRYGDARAVLSDAQERAPTSARVMTAAAVLEHRRDQLGRAHQLLTKALDVKPHYAPALFNLGHLSLIQMHDEPRGTAGYAAARKRAVDYFSSYVRIRKGSDRTPKDNPRLKTAESLVASLGSAPPPPKNPEVTKLLKTARDASTRNKLDVAMVALDTALKLAPEDADVLWARYRFFSQKLDDAIGATEALAQLRAAAPNDPRLRGLSAGDSDTLLDEQLEKAIALHAEGHYDHAIAIYRRVLKADASRTSTWHNLGLSYKAKGNLDAAIDAFVHAVERDPTNMASHYMLGVTHTARKEHDKAIAHLNRVIRLNDKHARAHLVLGIIYRDQGKTDLARIRLKRAIALGPNEPWAAQARTWLDVM